MSFEVIWRSKKVKNANRSKSVGFLVIFGQSPNKLCQSLKIFCNSSPQVVELSLFLFQCVRSLSGRMSSSNSPEAGGSLHPFFERGDQPHSRAKRELLKGSLLGFFATNMSVGSGSGDQVSTAELGVWSPFRQNSHLQVTYFDPFCGAGTYDGERSEAGNSMMSGDSCQYGSPIVAIDAAMIILKITKEQMKIRRISTNIAFSPPHYSGS